MTRNAVLATSSWGSVREEWLSLYGLPGPTTPAGP